MLPDYPKLKRQFRNLLIRMMERKTAQRAPLAGQIPIYRQSEGQNAGYEDHLGNIRASNPKEVRAAFTIPKSLPPLKTIQQIFEALEGAAEDMARQSETMLLAKVDESTRESGNVMDAAGRRLDPELLLESREYLD